LLLQLPNGSHNSPERGFCTQQKTLAALAGQSPTAFAIFHHRQKNNAMALPFGLLNPDSSSGVGL